jgi:dTDP-4-amino-4,6-dideoxygalactose transaminase
MIALNDVKEYNAGFIDDFTKDVSSLIHSGRYILGDTVAELETRISEYIGVRHCVGVSSGTSALELAFAALNLGPEDEVIIQANAYIACAFGILQSKAAMKIIDCELSGVFSISEFERNITPQTKAVLVVHLYGDCCNMERMVSLCHKKGIHLIEDCAQSFGSSYGTKKLGSFGVMSCHSFYPTKNLGALGDAGAICTNDERIADVLKNVRNLGSMQKYVHTMKGTNSRLDPIQACILLRKLPDVDRTIRIKRAIAEEYIRSIRHPHLKNPDPKAFSSYHLYVISVHNRDAFVEAMKSANIETIIHYPVPFYKSEAYSELNHLTFPIAEALSKTIVSIPLYCTLSSDQVRYIILHANGA